MLGWLGCWIEFKKLLFKSQLCYEVYFEVLGQIGVLIFTLNFLTQVENEVLEHVFYIF